MTTLLNVLVLGTIWGAVYSLIAVGFTLIFGVAGIINLSHGAFYMLGAYLAYTFMTLLKINVPLSALMAVGGVALIGMAIDHFGIRPLRDRHAYVLILTLAFALFFQELMYGIYGPYGKPVQSFVIGEIVLGGVHVSYQKLITLFVAVALVILLWFFIKKTKTGMSISAVAQNKDAAILVGIQYEKAYRMTMGISAGLAAVAGVFISPILEAVPTMWSFPLFKAFAIVIIGGLGSLEGAIIASLLLGYSETLVSFLISANYSDMVYLVAIILVLVLRPTGLLNKGRRA
ncbi:MAG: branched-chain amino acid ABC transporter permease [Deltaproteobacteria bacterium]|nr:branched-chain amino acid ABC transporter permease [Deltaproteobacteria bacterium]